MKKIYGKPIWGTDWSLKKEYKSLKKAKEIAKVLAKSSGVAHKVEEYYGTREGTIFQVWREIAPLEKRFSLPANLKSKF